MVDKENKNSCSDVDKDLPQGNIADANNDAVQLISESLLPEITEEDLFLATGTKLIEKENDVPDLNNLESSSSSSALSLALGIIIIKHLNLVKFDLLEIIFYVEDSAGPSGTLMPKSSAPPFTRRYKAKAVSSMANSKVRRGMISSY